MPTVDWSPATDQWGGTAWAPTITGVNLGPPLITGAPTTDQLVVISGRGQPGATIELEIDGVIIGSIGTVSSPIVPTTIRQVWLVRVAPEVALRLAPGALLRLGGRTIQQGGVGESGSWSYETILALGEHRIRARQVLNGATSGWSAITTILVEPGRVSAWGSAISGRK